MNMSKSLTRLLKPLVLAAALAHLPLAAHADDGFKSRTIRVSNGASQDHPVGAGAKAMGVCLTEGSGGKIKLRAFFDGSLGDDLQGTQAVRSGTYEMVVAGTSAIAGIVPQLNVFDLPFMFNDDAEVDTLLTGDFGKHIDGLMPDVGLVNLAWWENGFRNVTNSKRQIERWEDFGGLKLRVMQNKIFLDSFKAMGANAVPLAFGEVFTALETKAIDGQENPLTLIESSKFYEVQKHLSLTRHAYSPLMVMFSKKIWDTYSPQEQALLQQCANVGREAELAASRGSEERVLEVLKQAGVEINALAPEEVERMREKVQPVYEANAGLIGQETLDAAQQALQALRQQ